MLVSKLLKENLINLDFNLSNCLDDKGADGAVYDISDSKVLKISVIFDWNSNLESDYRNTNQVLTYLMSKPESAFAKVLDFKFIGSFSRFIHNKDVLQNYVLYYYVLEKLEKITEDEKKVFHTILSHEDANYKKNYVDRELDKTLLGLSSGLDFDSREVKLFCEQIATAKIIHNDIHPRNIMKTNTGSFRLIDFDRCQLKGNL